jgi:hypothetical protein
MNKVELYSLIFDVLKIAVPLVIGLAILGKISWALIDVAIKTWVQKLNNVVENKAGYITEAACKNCQAQDRSEKSEIIEALNSIKTEMRERNGELRGILLVVATKANVPPEDLKVLTR